MCREFDSPVICIHRHRMAKNVGLMSLTSSKDYYFVGDIETLESLVEHRISHFRRIFGHTYHCYDGQISELFLRTLDINGRAKHKHVDSLPRYDILIEWDDIERAKKHYEKCMFMECDEIIQSFRMLNL